MSALMQNLTYAISFACLLFALHLFIVRPVNRAPSLFLGAAFLVFAAQSALLAQLLVHGPPHWAAIIRPSLAMTIGPLLLFYFISAANPHFRFHAVHGLHFAPALFIAYELLTDTYPVDIDFAIIASFGAYAATVAWRARRGRAQFDHLGAAKNDAFRWMVLSAALLAASFVNEILIAVDIARGGALAQSTPLLVALLINLAVVGVAVVAALRRPSPFEWIYAFGAPLRARKTQTFSLEECTSCLEKFDQLLAGGWLFAAADASLRAGAAQLGVPARLLSEAINRIHGESYSRRMNRLRVEEAKRLLRADPDKPMIDVMFDAGFRTKSSFNKEFRAIEGASPSAYRAVFLIEGDARQGA